MNETLSTIERKCEMRKTHRGFGIYSEFKDTYGNTIIVQESSAATKHCCWVFTTNREGKCGTFNQATQSFISASPHLTKAQAKRLAKALLKFAESE